TITIGAAGAANFGTLNFNAAGAVGISQDGAVVLKGSSTAGSLTLANIGSASCREGTRSTVVAAAGRVTGTSNSLDHGTAASLSGSGDVTVAATGGGPSGTITIGAAGAANFGTLNFNAAGAVGISQDGAVVLKGSSTAGSLTLARVHGSVGDTPTTLLCGRPPFGGHDTSNILSHATRESQP